MRILVINTKASGVVTERVRSVAELAAEPERTKAAGLALGRRMVKEDGAEVVGAGTIS